MNTLLMSMLVGVIDRFIEAYRERTRQQRESAKALMQLQREQFQKLSQ